MWQAPQIAVITLYSTSPRVRDWTRRSVGMKSEIRTLPGAHSHCSRAPRHTKRRRGNSKLLFCETQIRRRSKRCCHRAGLVGECWLPTVRRVKFYEPVPPRIESRGGGLHNSCGSARGPVILPNFKLGDPSLRGRNGGFDSHTLPPIYGTRCVVVIIRSIMSRAVQGLAQC